MHKTWEKYKSFMAIIEKCIRRKEIDIQWATLTGSAAAELYAQVKGEVELEGRSHKRRHAQLKWTTVLKNFEAERSAQNKRRRAAA
jgi:hypothetical protein